MPASAQSGSHSHAFPPLSPTMSGPMSNVDTGLPMRHPRPMTPAEMHLELEKEQEAAVNRLTRELSALRAHSASVASTASIASSGASGVHLDVTDAAHTGSQTGSTHPTSARRHRSSSSVSRSYPHRYSVSSQPATNDTLHRSPSVFTTPRYEEVAHQRAELEEVRRENERLKQRIRDLERMIRTSDDGQRGRQGAPSSTGAGVGTQTGTVSESYAA
jgi:hypothetical protein